MTINRSSMTGFVFVVLLGLWSPVHAQVPEELARRLVGEGIEAAKSFDWVTARERFEQAYQIQPLPLTLYNLAAAQEKTGQYVEADRSYRLFLRETEPGENEDFRTAASSRRVELRDKIGYVTLRAENIVPDDKIRMGGREIAQAALGEPIPSNPGSFHVRVERDGEVVASEQFRLGEGESLVIPLKAPLVRELMPVVNLPSDDPPQHLVVESQATAEPPTDSGSLFTSPIFWAIAGAVVVAGSIGGYFVFRPEGAFDSTLAPVEIDGR